MTLRPGSLQSNILICLYVMLISMSIGKVIPLVPSMAASLHVSEAQAAWLISVVTVAGILIAPFGGQLSSRFDDRLILMAAIGIGIIGNITAMLGEDFGMALVGRLIEGFALFLVLNSAMTLLMRTNDGARLSGALAFFLACFPVGIAVSAAIAGGLDRYGWYYAFGAHSAILAVALPSCLLLPRVATSAHQFTRSSARLVDAYRRMPPIALGLMLAGLSIGQLGGVSLYPAYLVEKFGIPMGGAVAIGSGGMIVGILGNAGAGFLLGRGVSVRRIVMASLALMVAFGFFSFSGSLGLQANAAFFMLFLIFAGCASSALLAFSPLVAARPELMGQSNAIINQINNIGMLVAPPLMFEAFAVAGAIGLQGLVVLCIAAVAFILQISRLGQAGPASSASIVQSTVNH